MTPDDIRTLARKAKLWTNIFQFAGNNDPDSEQRGAQPPTGHYPMEEIRETWEGNGKFSHYYARWCRADITRVFIDAGLLTTIEAFCGAPFTDILPTPTPIATAHHAAHPPTLIEVA